MSLTTTETLGFADGVIEFLTNPRAGRQHLKAQLRTKTDGCAAPRASRRLTWGRTLLNFDSI